MKKKPAESTKLSYTRINDEVSDQLYVQIIQKIGVEKRYRDADYSARKLAADLHTNPRYISVVVALHTGGNYSALVNGYRLRDACRMLRSPRYRDYTVEEIGLECGFASRQAFYLAFHRLYKVTPRQYRLKGAK
ncbi:MAG: helix-turn-helix transcriptional regulator [Alloprevotella sp.]|nr:helix-turn-helix transcriptional regulator [Alloprevotella sp.]MBR1652329.1 helix-turn-helix transcriptional regulator [Alloprevotella sp.]